MSESTEQPSEQQEPEVVFEPSPKLEEQINQPTRETRRQAKASQSSGPGIYVYEGDSDTYHTVLGKLVPGENDFSGLTHPEELQALHEAVEAGLLRKA
jgi:hypothetical protein